MKIAFVNIYSGVNHRGAEAFAHQLGNRLQKNHQVVFYQAGIKLAKQQMRVIQITMMVKQPQSQFPKGVIAKIGKYLFLDRANLNVLKFTLKTLPSILKNRFDYVIPMNGFWQLLLLKIVQPIGKFKILVTGHAGPGWDDRLNLYLKPNAFVAITKPAYDWARKTCPWTKTRLIPLAVDVNTFQKAKKKKLALSNPIVLCPAALVGYKRVHLAIKAVAKLPKVSLVILGKGKLKSEIIRLGSRLLGKRFYLASVLYDKMPSYYQVADVVTLPSSPQENSPMVFLESLVAGKMVVATNTPRNRWMLDQAGVFCDPENVADYAKALKKALTMSSKQGTARAREKRSIDRVIEKALSKFRWQKAIKKYENLFNNLVNK